jgi:hypothetical protein
VAEGGWGRKAGPGVAVEDVNGYIVSCGLCQGGCQDLLNEASVLPRLGCPGQELS